MHTMRGIKRSEPDRSVEKLINRSSTGLFDDVDGLQAALNGHISVARTAYLSIKHSFTENLTITWIDSYDLSHLTYPEFEDKP